MKRIAFAVVGTLLIAIVPIAAIAQDVFESPPMGMPGPPTALMAPPPMPGPGMGPGPGGPPPMPYGCSPPCQKSLGSGSLYAGYLFSNKQGFKFTREATDAVDQPDLVYRFPVQGVLLAASAIFPAGESFGITGAGALLIPVKTNGTADEEGLAATALSSSADANNQLGFLETSAFYKFYEAEWGSFQAVAGFRWDHFTSKLTYVARDEADTFERNTTANLTVDAYLPFFGLRMSQPTPSSYFNARIIAFPTLPGNVKFQNSFHGTENNAPLEGGGEFSTSFKNGYFLEIFAEYGAKVLGDFFVGGFGAYDILQGKTGEGSYISGTDALSEQIVLNRSTWTFGGTIAYQF